MSEQGFSNFTEGLVRTPREVVYCAKNSGDNTAKFETITQLAASERTIKINSFSIRAEPLGDGPVIAQRFDYERYRNSPLFSCLSDLIASTDPLNQRLVSTSFTPAEFPKLGRKLKVVPEDPTINVGLSPRAVKFTAYIQPAKLTRLLDLPSLDELILFQRRLICPSKLHFVLDQGKSDFDIQHFLYAQKPDSSLAHPSGEAQRAISVLLAQQLVSSFGSEISLVNELIAKAAELGIELDLTDLHAAFSDLVSNAYCYRATFQKLTDDEQAAYFQIIAHWQLSLALEINRQKKAKSIEMSLFNVFPVLRQGSEIPTFAYWSHIVTNTEKFIAALGSIIPAGYLVRLEQIDGVIKSLDESLLRALEATIDSYQSYIGQSQQKNFAKAPLQSKLQSLQKSNIPEAARELLESMVSFIGDISEKEHVKRRRKLLDKVRAAINANNVVVTDFHPWERAWLGLEEWRSYYTSHPQLLDKRKETTGNTESHLQTLRAQIDEITRAGGRETLSFKIKHFFAARRNRV